MRIFRATTLFLLAGAAPALAGTKPLYQPAPAWVVPAPLDPASVPDGSNPILIFDQQQRLADGQVWSYVDSANRVTSEQALANAGTVSLQWQPDDGDLIVHRIAIVRGGQTIDLLTDPEPLTILRRERGLEQLSIDGILTATMPVKGLQVGDVLRVTYSVTHSDPVLKGALQSTALLLADPARADFARVRVLWKPSTDLHWKLLAKTGEPRLTTVGDYRELNVPLPIPKQPDLPGDAPPRFRPLPLLEVSTFKDWADVSRVMAPLYDTSGLITPGSPLAAEVARIKAASSDPKVRAALALRTVQSEVRYLFKGLDHGNYVPQPPEKTWSVRYGDCKAKTLLLLALLHDLDITAEPVMANLQFGDHVPRRLPAALAFNHVLVAATIAGQTYWLDGTAAGTRLADLGDTPDLRNVLPVRAAGAALLAVRTHANARPNFEVAEDIDQSAGIGIVAPFKATITVRGGLADAINTSAAAVSADKRKEMIDGVVTKVARPALIISRDIKYDVDSATVVIHAAGLTGGDWNREDQRFQWMLDRSVENIKFDGDRGRPEWRDIPVATAGVQGAVLSVTLHLPADGKGFALDGDQTLPARLAGATVAREASLAGATVTLRDRVDETAVEIAPADIAATRAAIALAQSRRLKVVAPRDYPRRAVVIRAAAAAGRFKPIEAAFAQAIADATEKTPAYLERANFRSNIYDRKGAIADLDVAIATRPDANTYLRRAYLLWATRNDQHALADAKAAFALDPGSNDVVESLAQYQSNTGQRDAALQLLDSRISAGGQDKSRLLAAKADVLARAGDADGALAAIDAAIAGKPGDAGLLNARCWIKGTLGVKLDTALKDCTKSIELGDSAAAALDSRAMVYFKLGRLDDALVDLDAVLDLVPELSASLYMRGIVEERQGKAAAAAADLDAARFASPRIDEDYARYGVKPGAPAKAG